MGWMNQLGGLLGQYMDAQNPDRAEQDFDEVSRHAPRDAMAGGLAEAFRSDRTPPFANMLGQLFGNSNSNMKASLLNTLIAAAGPQVLSAILARHSGSSAPKEINVQSGHLSPEEADRVPAAAVEELADEAQKRDPNVIDQISDFYAEHPTLVKSLGAAALAVAMSHFAKQR
jgi:hypothetical protein